MPRFFNSHATTVPGVKINRPTASILLPTLLHARINCDFTRHSHGQRDRHAACTQTQYIRKLRPESSWVAPTGPYRRFRLRRAVPVSWYHIHKQEGDALERGNYKMMKLFKLVLKVCERLIKKTNQKESDDSLESVCFHVGYRHDWCHLHHTIGAINYR
jgi:hypothetical protein